MVPSGHLVEKEFIMLIFGLLLVAVAGVAGTVGVLSNRGTGHQVPGGFDALGYTMHGPTGQLFFWGIVVGCVAMLGLVLILGGLRGGVKRRSTARRNATWRKRSEKEAALATDAPVTDPSVAEPSAIDEPVTEPPVTEPPVTELPVTKSSTTDEPAPELVAAVPPAAPESNARIKADPTLDKVGS
jgi:hypothetical protein